MDKKRSVIITGAASGIGYATALKFASKGYNLLLGDINPKISDIAKEISEKYNTSAVGLLLDVKDWNSCKEFYEKGINSLGVDHIDILVNNAGILRDALFVKMTYEQWDEVIKVHLYGAFNMTKQVVEGMIKQGWGRIINLSSISWLGNIGQANYSAAKAGIIGFTRTLAKELGRYGITVNAVVPGVIDTPMTRNLPDKIKQMFMDRIPLRRVGNPEEVANLIFFLASDEASYINGSIIEITGGFTP
ncbi:MAG: beta-ketoacyl-ACP reductase [Sulfolobaceae archaeon]